jgi:hypothetical protein
MVCVVMDIFAFLLLVSAGSYRVDGDYLIIAKLQVANIAVHI